MKLIKCEDYDDACEIASNIMINDIKNNPNITLGLATGSTPLGIYKNLVSSYNRQEISFLNVKTFNLDEYIGLEKDSKESYKYFMENNLFNHIDIKKENVNIPFAKNINDNKSVLKYNELLKENIIDLQLLGIGENGHIGFNEPKTSFEQETFIVKLHDSTIEANKRFFNRKEDVPKYAITMGIKNILNAKKILLVVTGEKKAKVLKELLTDEISELLPASALNLHNNVIVIADKAALSLV